VEGPELGRDCVADVAGDGVLAVLDSMRQELHRFAGGPVHQCLGSVCDENGNGTTQMSAQQVLNRRPKVVHEIETRHGHTGSESLAASII
jgi:hypothetical protein